MRITEVTIDFRKMMDTDGKIIQIYFVTAPSDYPSVELWLGRDLSLTRVVENRGFLREWKEVVFYVDKILSGEIREGIPYSSKEPH